jgi:hypothetical protein
MQQLLTQMNLYTLTDRCPQTYDFQTFTYSTTKGETVVQVCKSAVDYIVAPEHMYQASAVGGVQQDQWEISGSAHRVLWPRKASYAMGSVLHNHKLDTEIRRVVLLAKLRLVLEYYYCSTVWHAATDCCGAEPA